MQKWWDKYGGWVVLLAIILLACLRAIYLPPLPRKYEWTVWVGYAVFILVVAYFSFREPRDPD